MSQQAFPRTWDGADTGIRLTVKCHTLVMRACPTAMCHASTLLKLASGQVLCAWFGGSVEGADDVGIYLAKGVDGRFGEPRLVAASDEPHWNPVLFQLDARTVALFYKVGRVIRSWRTMVMLSEDGGETFSPARELVPSDIGGRGPVRSKCIRLLSGAIAAPSSYEEAEHCAFVDRSDDNGDTWHPSNMIYAALQEGPARQSDEDARAIPVSEQSYQGRGIIQPTLWESAPGQVHALMRSSEGFIYRADSVDDARSFTSARPTELPNNNSGIDVARMPDGLLLLLHNPVGVNWGARSPMRLSASRDNGAHFVQLADLDGGEGEFSYPAVVVDGARAHVSYTFKRRNIAYWEIDITKEKGHE